MTRPSDPSGIRRPGASEPTGSSLRDRWRAARSLGWADHRRQLTDWLRVSPSGLVPLALLVGAGAGGGAVLFRYLILWFTEVFTGRGDYSNVGHVGSAHFPGLGIYFVVLVPVIGGLIYGPIVERFAQEARGHGVPEVMLAVAERGGRISPAVAAVKSVASALCIGSGGSVGREGPIVQIGSALGSTTGQVLKVPETRLRLLVSCGAAGGIAATFNAPIAGVFFALELILRSFAAESFGAVVLASVTASVIGRAAFGNQPFLALPTFRLVSPTEFLLYALLGLLTAVAGTAFTRVLYGLEDLFDRLWRWPESWRPAAGGVLLGLLLLGLPEMYGVGYPVLERGIQHHYVAWFLLVLMAGKIAATSLTIAIGGSGGVFAPSLFMGAMLGTAYGAGVHHLFPGATAPAGAYGLVAMGGVFAGAARAPITAVLIVFELTGDYQIVLPLMVTVVLSTAFGTLLTHDSIYTLKLRRRGIDILQGRQANLMEILSVKDAMQPIPTPIHSNDTISGIIDLLSVERVDALPVVDESGAYRGAITSREVEESARANRLDSTALDLVRTTATLTPDQTLQSALGALIDHDRTGLPVLSPDGTHLIGWLSHRDVLRAYSTRIRQSAQQSASQPSSVVPTPTPLVLPDRTLDARLQGLRVIELDLGPGAAPVGQRISDIAWPASTLLLAIRRNGEAFPPEHATTLEAGDRLTLLVPADQAETLVDRISQTPDETAHTTDPSPGS